MKVHKSESLAILRARGPDLSRDALCAPLQ